MQGVPAFLFALFATNKRTDVHPWCLSISALAGVLYCFIIYFGYITAEGSSPAPIDAGITGFTVQVVLIVLLESTRRLLFNVNDQLEDQQMTNKNELWFPNRPAFDIPCTARFGERILTPHMMWKMMEGVHESLTNWYYVFFMIMSVSIITPLVPAGFPEDPEDAPTVNGLPWWAMKAILLCIIPYAMNLIVVLRMPNDYPAADPSKIETEGFDPDLVELSFPEMGQRTSYDAPNVSVTRRRSSIRSSMKSMGLALPGEGGGPHRPSEGARRLSSMIAGDADILQALKELNEEEEEGADSENGAVDIAGQPEQVEVAQKRPSNLFIAQQMKNSKSSDDEADA